MDIRAIVDDIESGVPRVRAATPRGAGADAPTAEARAALRVAAALESLGHGEQVIRDVLALVFRAEEEAVRHAAMAGCRPLRPLSDIAPERAALLRPMAETLAMVDGNAFLGMTYRDGEGREREWWEQYLPEADAIYEGNGGDTGWAGEASFSRAARGEAA